NLPILAAYAPHHEASGRLVGISTSRYVPLNWHHLAVEWRDLREVFWDVRLLQFLLIAAALGALRRNYRSGLFLVVWFVAYSIFKGMASQASVADTSYFRLTLPGLVALIMLLPAIGFLVPGTRPIENTGATRETWCRNVRLPVAIAALIAVLVP